jgi:imidazolonepropionase-like amidohydrolase
MGTYAELRDVFFKALEHSSKLAQYKQDERAWEKKRARAKELGESGTAPKAIAPPSPPGRNEGYETLAAAVRGEILVHVHCYRQDDIVQILAVADEVGFSVRSFHHALEAYKVRDELVRRNVSISTWADWFGFKMEAFDGIPESIALFTQSGGRAIVHSDSPIGIQRLNQEAAKALAVGRAAGIKLTDDDALKWITLHAAWALGIDDRTGSLEPNKRADFVIWDRHPFSTYARPDAVYVRGMATFERAKGMPLTDFELGVGGDDGGAP